jgi:AraC-like DNA-binding protein/effector-binding domain-containing protein
MTPKDPRARWRRVQPIMAFVARHLEDDLSLGALARRARLSRFHLQRLFSATAHETLKQYTARLRLDRAAARLLEGTDSVLSIALDSGFSSHETFCRAFQRRFGMTPTACRRRGALTLASAADLARHAALIARVGPCIGLLHTAQQQTHGERSMPYSVTQKELSPQPVLVARTRVRRTDIAKALAEQLGRIFQHVQGSGGVIAGQPFTRYLEWGPGVLTLEIGLPIAQPLKEGSAQAENIRADTLPGGPVAATTHMGTYEKLNEAHAAVQVWMEEKNLRGAGAPWEVYVSDPAEVPDPANWRTDIFWPLQP